MKTKIILSVIIISSFIAVTLYGGTHNSTPGYFFELTLKTNGGGFRPDYGLYIAKFLEEIGIKVNVRVVEWADFVGTLLETYDFDLAFIAIIGGSDPDKTSVYSENGSLNMFGINTEIPYGEENEEMLAQGIKIMDLAERQNHYYNWQQLIMDKILPMVPFFTPYGHSVNWATLDGYDHQWGIVDSLPYMEFVALHEGQVSTDEFNDFTSNWFDLNPLILHDAASNYVSSLVMEDLLKLSPSFEPIKTGLIVDWQQDSANENLFRFTLRDNVFWNPSFNITERDANSDPLVDGSGNIIDPSILMVGDKGEFSDGTNQQVTAKDAVFTLLTWANPITSGDADNYKWIHDIWVDPSDPLSFWLEIDGDPDTPELDPYALFWTALSTAILPEFFLNTTSATVTYSSGNVPMIGIYEGIFDTPQWQAYSFSAFGCGKYMLDYYVKNSITVLKASPFWFGVGAIDGTEQDLDIKTFNIRVISDQSSALAEFKAGKLDIFRDISSYQEERKEMETDPKFEVQSSLRNYFSFLAFNLRRPFIGGDDNFVFLTEPGYEEYTKALAVRKAIAYVIDREKINLNINEGENFITDSPISPILDFWCYNDIVKYNRNLDLAWEWMERAGYSSSSLIDGITLYGGGSDTVTSTNTVTETETVTSTLTETTTVSEPTTVYSTVTNKQTKKILYPFSFLITMSVIALIPIYSKIRKIRR